MGKIEIKAWYRWCETDEDKALKFARHMYRHALPRIKESDKADYINKHHLKGIEFTQEQLQWQSQEQLKEDN